ncbi:hypothetical protein DSO57_1002634 [Entomophthora muscae]|uniref:Uncharacterized protein n=1 Tax=Entomophthora muscae TaxID=34485 RepID=A0ACC2SXN9_9FUNG|nr:hypothetical protein DSO57_1002634 [Entomophthora muscae]
MEVEFGETSSSNLSQAVPIVIESSAVEPEVEPAVDAESEAVQNLEQQEDILPQEVQAPEDVGFDRPHTPKSSSPSALESFCSCNSTVIIDSPKWPEITESPAHLPKIPTYLMPTKSQQAKRRSGRINESLIKQPPKAIPESTNEGTPFSLATTMRAQKNDVPSRFLTKPIPVKHSGIKRQTQPRSPALATKYRKRRAPPTEDEPTQFKALPLNKKILQPHTCQGVPRVKIQPTTVAVSPKFSRVNRSKPGVKQDTAQTDGTRPSTSLSTARQSRAAHVRSTKPTTVPKSPNFQTNARLGRPPTRLSKRSGLSE